MLDKKAYIDFWVKQADDDWGAVEALFSVEKYNQSLFWAHLVAEKLAKAIWIKNNADNIPPKTHNIAYLLSKTSITIPQEIMEIMLLANVFNIEGRYPEYIEDMEESMTRLSTQENIDKIKILIKWFRQNLQ